MLRLLLPAMLLVASPAAAMSAAEFLAKVDGLKAKGPLALFSPDIGALKREGKGAMQAWYAQAKPAGQRPNACPPVGPVDLKQKEFLGYLRAVPEPQRGHTSVADAITAGLNHRFPCAA